MLSEAKRKRINATLQRGLFINKKGKLIMRKQIAGEKYEKNFGTWFPGLTAEAEEYLNNLRGKHRRNRLGIPEPDDFLSFEQAVGMVWRDHYSKKPPTYAAIYRAELDRILKYFGSPTWVHNATTKQCNEFLDWRAAQPNRYTKGKIVGSTVDKSRSVLRKFFNLLEEWQEDGSIAENVRLPKRNPARFTPKRETGESPIQPPTDEQYNAILINAVDNGIRRIVMGAAVMMRRMKELKDMTLSNVDHANGVIRGLVSKRKAHDKPRQYTVVITPVVQMLLDTAPSRHIFDFTNFRRRWEQTLVRAGLAVKIGETFRHNGRQKVKVPLYEFKVQFLGLRKMGGTHLNQAGTDPRTIQSMYVHSSLDMSQRYIGVVPEAVRQAASTLDSKYGWKREVVVKPVVGTSVLQTVGESKVTENTGEIEN